VKVEGVNFRLLDDKLLKGQERENKSGESFFETLKKEIEGAEKTVKNAEIKTLEIASGKSDDVLGAVVAMTEAELTVKAAVQIRNKVVQTYQTLIHMQV
jgi:flagellar hook-basal body complex protein FliE